MWAEGRQSYSGKRRRQALSKLTGFSVSRTRTTRYAVGWVVVCCRRGKEVGGRARMRGEFDERRASWAKGGGGRRKGATEEILDST